MNEIVKNIKNNRISSITKGWGVAVVLSMISIFIYATILVNTDVKESTIKPVLITISGISILIGSSISSLKIKKNGILNGVCVGAMYFVTLYLLSSIALCGFYLNLSALTMILVGMVLGGVGGTIGVNLK